MENRKLDEIHQGIKDLRGEVRDLREEVKEYSKQTTIISRDLMWLKGSLKYALTPILTIITGTIGYLIKIKL